MWGAWNNARNRLFGTQQNTQQNDEKEIKAWQSFFNEKNINEERQQTIIRTQLSKVGLVPIDDGETRIEKILENGWGGVFGTNQLEIVLNSCGSYEFQFVVEDSENQTKWKLDDINLEKSKYSQIARAAQILININRVNQNTERKGLNNIYNQIEQIKRERTKERQLSQLFTLPYLLSPENLFDYLNRKVEEIENRLWAEIFVEAKVEERRRYCCRETLRALAFRPIGSGKKNILEVLANGWDDLNTEDDSDYRITDSSLYYVCKELGKSWAIAINLKRHKREWVVQAAKLGAYIANINQNTTNETLVKIKEEINKLDRKMREACEKGSRLTLPADIKIDRLNSLFDGKKKWLKGRTEQTEGTGDNQSDRNSALEGSSGNRRTRVEARPTPPPIIVSPSPSGSSSALNAPENPAALPYTTLDEAKAYWIKKVEELGWSDDELNDMDFIIHSGYNGWREHILCRTSIDGTLGVEEQAKLLINTIIPTRLGKKRKTSKQTPASQTNQTATRRTAAVGSAASTSANQGERTSQGQILESFPEESAKPANARTYSEPQVNSSIHERALAVLGAANEENVATIAVVEPTTTNIEQEFRTILELYNNEVFLGENANLDLATIKDYIKKFADFVPHWNDSTNSTSIRGNKFTEAQRNFFEKNYTIAEHFAWLEKKRYLKEYGEELSKEEKLYIKEKVGINWFFFKDLIDFWLDLSSPTKTQPWTKERRQLWESRFHNNGDFNFGKCLNGNERLKNTVRQLISNHWDQYFDAERFKKVVKFRGGKKILEDGQREPIEFFLNDPTLANREINCLEEDYLSLVEEEQHESLQPQREAQEITEARRLLGISSEVRISRKTTETEIQNIINLFIAKKEQIEQDSSLESQACRERCWELRDALSIILRKIFSFGENQYLFVCDEDREGKQLTIEEVNEQRSNNTLLCQRCLERQAQEQVQREAEETEHQPQAETQHQEQTQADFFAYERGNEETMGKPTNLTNEQLRDEGAKVSNDEENGNRASSDESDRESVMTEMTDDTVRVPTNNEARHDSNVGVPAAPVRQLDEQFDDAASVASGISDRTLVNEGYGQSRRRFAHSTAPLLSTGLPPASSNTTLSSLSHHDFDQFSRRSRGEQSRIISSIRVGSRPSQQASTPARDLNIIPELRGEEGLTEDTLTPFTAAANTAERHNPYNPPFVVASANSISTAAQATETFPNLENASEDRIRRELGIAQGELAQREAEEERHWQEFFDRLEARQEWQPRFKAILTVDESFDPRNVVEKNDLENIGKALDIYLTIEYFTKKDITNKAVITELGEAVRKLNNASLPKNLTSVALGEKFKTRARLLSINTKETSEETRSEVGETHPASGVPVERTNSQETNHSIETTTPPATPRPTSPASTDEGRLPTDQPQSATPAPFPAWYNPARDGDDNEAMNADEASSNALASEQPHAAETTPPTIQLSRNERRRRNQIAWDNLFDKLDVAQELRKPCKQILAANGNFDPKNVSDENIENIKLALNIYWSIEQINEHTIKQTVDEIANEIREKLNENFLPKNLKPSVLDVKLIEKIKKIGRHEWAESNTSSETPIPTPEPNSREISEQHEHNRTFTSQQERIQEFHHHDPSLQVENETAEEIWISEFINSDRLPLNNNEIIKFRKTIDDKVIEPAKARQIFENHWKENEIECYHKDSIIEAFVPSYTSFDQTDIEINAYVVDKLELDKANEILNTINEAQQISDLPAESDISAVKYDENKVPNNKNYDSVKTILKNKKQTLEIARKTTKAQGDITKIENELNKNPIISASELKKPDYKTEIINLADDDTQRATRCQEIIAEINQIRNAKIERVQKIISVAQSVLNKEQATKKELEKVINDLKILANAAVGSAERIVWGGERTKNQKLLTDLEEKLSKIIPPEPEREGPESPKAPTTPSSSTLEEEKKKMGADYADLKPAQQEGRKKIVENWKKEQNYSRSKVCRHCLMEFQFDKNSEFLAAKEKADKELKSHEDNCSLKNSNKLEIEKKNEDNWKKTKQTHNRYFYACRKCWGKIELDKTINDWETAKKQTIANLAYHEEEECGNSLVNPKIAIYFSPNQGGNERAPLTYAEKISEDELTIEMDNQGAIYQEKQVEKNPNNCTPWLIGGGIVIALGITVYLWNKVFRKETK